MSVISVTQMWSKTGGSSQTNKRDIYDNKYSFTEGYQVVHDVGTDVTEVMSAGPQGLPQHGDIHSSGVDAYVNAINASQLSPILSVVTIGYAGQTIDPGTIDIEWSDVTTTEPIDRDYNGDAIVTANGEPVDGLSMDVSDQICVIRRKFTSIDTAAIAQYRRATNSDTFLGWPAGTARLVGFSAKNQFKVGVGQQQWDVTARFQFREPLAGTTAAQAWYKRWRHEGLYILDEDTDLIRRARDDEQQEVVKPVLLKLDGTRETDPSAAVFMHTQVYGSLPYAALGLL